MPAKIEMNLANLSGHPYNQMSGAPPACAAAFDRMW